MRGPDYLHHILLELGFHISLYNCYDKCFGQNQTPLKEIRTLSHLDSEEPHLLQQPHIKPGH